MDPRESARLNQQSQAYFQHASQEIRVRMGNLREEGLSFLDLTTVFDEVKEDVFLDHYHLGDRGNQLVARRLAETVQRVLEAGVSEAAASGGSPAAQQHPSPPPPR